MSAETPTTNVKLVSCCWSHYCNGASGPVVNGILLTATVTASFIYLFGYSLGFIALSSAEAPAGYPHQNINNRKNRKRGGRWEEGNGGSLSSLFPLPIVPRALSFSFSPASPQHKSLPTTQRGLCGGERLHRLKHLKMRTDHLKVFYLFNLFWA